MSKEDSAVASLTYTRRKNGSIEVTASATIGPEDIPVFLPIVGASTKLIKTSLIQPPPNLPSEFFRELINEINIAYSYQLYTSAYVCLRKLFENLIIELLRREFGTTELSIYYWSEKGRFHHFSKLIENFESRVSDFRPHTSSFDQHFFDFLKNFREVADSNAHSIDIYTDSKDFEDKREKMNYTIALLCDVISGVE